MSNVSALGYIQQSENFANINATNLVVTGELVNQAPSVTAGVAHDAATISAARIAGKYMRIGTGAGGGYVLALTTGALLSAALPNAAAGYVFDCVLHEVGGQACTLSGGVGTTLVGGATIVANKIAILRFICTAADTWSVAKLDTA
jgi:hypothetical protein